MVPESVITQVSDSRGVISTGSTHGFYDWLFECHGFWQNATLIISSFLFVLYLTLQARHTFLKLSHARSYIIFSYNASLWLVTLLNLAWCFLQVRFNSCIIIARFRCQLPISMPFFHKEISWEAFFFFFTYFVAESLN